MEKSKGLYTMEYLLLQLEIGKFEGKMNFNQSNGQNEKYMQMEQYFLKNQNKWYTGKHDLISENHPVHHLSLDDTFFKPTIDEEDTIDSKTLDSFFKDKLELNELHVSSEKETFKLAIIIEEAPHILLKQKQEI